METLSNIELAESMPDELRSLIAEVLQKHADDQDIVLGRNATETAESVIDGTPEGLQAISEVLDKGWDKEAEVFIG